MGSCVSTKSLERYRHEDHRSRTARGSELYPVSDVQDNNDSSLYEDVDPQPLPGQATADAAANRIRREESVRTLKSDDSAFDDACSRNSTLTSEHTDSNKAYSYTYTDISPRKETPNIGEMVEKYRDKLEFCVQAKEIVNYIPFIASKFEILQKAIDSPRIAMRMLLDQLHCSEEPGKWQTFIHALTEAGYKDIVQALEGTPTNDQKQNHVAILNIFTQTLCQSLTPTEILPNLVAKRVISEFDSQNIEREENNNGRIAASGRLLALLPHKSPTWFVDFLSTLRECHLGFLADKIEGVKPSSAETIADEEIPKDSYLTIYFEQSDGTVAKFEDTRTSYTCSVPADSTYDTISNGKETTETCAMDNSKTTVCNSRQNSHQLSCSSCTSMKDTLSEMLEVHQNQIQRYIADQMSEMTKRVNSAVLQREFAVRDTESTLPHSHKPMQRRHSESDYISCNHEYSISSIELVQNRPYFIFTDKDKTDYIPEALLTRAPVQRKF